MVLRVVGQRVLPGEVMMATFGLIFPAVWVWIAMLLNCLAWGVRVK